MIDEIAFQKALLDLGAQDDFNAWNLDEGNIRFLVGRYEAAKSAKQPVDRSAFLLALDIIRLDVAERYRMADKPEIYDALKTIAAWKPEREAAQPVCFPTDGIILKMVDEYYRDTTKDQIDRMKAALCIVWPPMRESVVPAGAALVKTIDEIWGRPPQNSNCVYAQSAEGVWTEVQKFNEIEDQEGA